MQRNLPGLKAISAICFLLIQYSCTKIDSTTLGSDLIPAVDNVNTFDTTLSIEATQGLFDDTTRLIYSDYHVLGSITNDPIFGSTAGTVYLELKPPYFPFAYGSASDTINNVLAPGTGFDSAVLCLSVKGIYGDSTKQLRFSVHQMNSNTGNFKNDTSHFVSYQPDALIGPSIGEATIVPSNLKDKIMLNTKKDSVTYQLRIKLNDDYLRNTLLANLDTSASGFGNNIYRNDSIFKSIIKGFAVVPEQVSESNSLLYTSLTDATTRLEVHFRRKNRNKIDTSFSSFIFSVNLYSSSSYSAHANNVTRDRVTGNPEYPNRQDADALYLQSVPGTYAILKIPALSALNNRIIHRAEITAEQIPADPVYSGIFPASNFLYLDLKDTGAVSRFKTVYTDLNTGNFYDPDNSAFPYPSQGLSIPYFGGFKRYKKDVFGNTIAYYNFNVSRYVQRMVTQQGTNFEMRLYAPYLLYYYNKVYTYPGGNFLLANGGVKIGNGNNDNYKLRMRIIYSKI